MEDEDDEVERVVIRHDPKSTSDIIRDHFRALLTAILTGNRLDQLIRSQIFRIIHFLELSFHFVWGVSDLRSVLFRLPVRRFAVRPPKISGFGLRITDYGLHNTLRITYYALRITYYVLRITYYGLRITDYGLRITDYGLRITDYGFKYFESCKLQSTDASIRLFVLLSSYKFSAVTYTLVFDAAT
jgi:hypothetical protein